MGRRGFRGRGFSAGFSLIELMTAVAIMGILAGVAIPNYLQYQRKAMQSQAKISVSSIYAFEQTFRLEKGTFSACLSQIGYAPDSQRAYTVGFADPVNVVACGRYCPSGGLCLPCNQYAQLNAVNATYQCPTPVAFIATQNGPSASPGFPQASDFWSTSLLGTPNISANAFTAQAVGKLGSKPDSLGMSSLDVWTITEFKRLKNANSGL